MTPGPDAIVACPICSALAKYRTLLSGNTFGTEYWSDGKQVSPMLPLPPPVVQCKACRAFYWLGEATQVGYLPMPGMDSDDVDPAWYSAENLEELSEGEFYEAIRGGLAKDGLEEQSLRMLALRRSNDPFRNGNHSLRETASERSSDWYANAESLLGLLDSDEPEHYILKAEIHREMGEFGKAEELLKSIPKGKLDGVVSQLLSHCRARSTTVERLMIGEG